MMNAQLIKSEETSLGKFSTSIPLDTPLANLRLRMQEHHTYSYGTAKYNLGYDYRNPLSPTALATLAESGIVLVSDLSGRSAKDLEVFKGIGTESARKITRVVKAAGGVYRGEGFPWEFSLDITIPDEFVTACKGAGKKDVISIFKESLNPKVILADLSEKVRLAKIVATKADIAALNKRLKLLKG